MPFMGITWVHDDLVELYENISKKNYIIVYLSSRNIGLSSYTKRFLDFVK